MSLMSGCQLVSTGSAERRQPVCGVDGSCGPLGGGNDRAPPPPPLPLPLILTPLLFEISFQEIEVLKEYLKHLLTIPTASHYHHLMGAIHLI